MKALFFVGAFTLLSSIARAECPKDAKWCDGFAIGASPTAVNLKTGAMIATLPLGACVGVTYQPLMLGMDACLNVQAATKDAPNTYIGALMIHWRQYGGLGIGALCRQNSNEQGVYCQAVAIIEARVPVYSW